MHPLLQKRLTTRHLHQPAWILFHLRHDLAERSPLALVERVLGVAISAAQIAPRQPHKNARLPRERTLALDAVKNLVDRERIRRGLRLRGCFQFGAHKRSLALEQRRLNTSAPSAKTPSSPPIPAHRRS